MVLPSFLVLSLMGAAATPSEGAHFEAPYFRLALGGQLPLEETHADLGIVGPIARVQVRQTYRNTGPVAIEAVYVFPASTQAAVHGLRMTIGSRTIEAKIQKRAQAREDYEAAKANGQTASLLEQERPNVFTMNVANILPGDRISVVLDYSELLVPTDGIYELVYPAVVGPRYSTTPEAWTQNPHTASTEAPPFRFGLTAKIEAGLPLASISCPSHAVAPQFLSTKAARIELNDPASGDRDFVLRYRLAQDQIEGGLSLFPTADGGYFLLQLEPPARVPSEKVVPREYVFIVDVSGSMAGFPLATAKTLLKDLLARLRPTDRFNVLLFAGGSTVLAPESLPANRPNLERALETIDNQRGGGGTELLPALRRALALPRAKDVGGTAIVLITDGYVTVEKEALELIEDNLGRASVFAFGIGSSVNRYLIEALARAGQGEPFVVLNEGAAGETAERFLRYVEQPVLTQVTAHAQGFEAYDLEPATLPDLYASRPVVLLGRYRGAPSGRLVIKGQTPLGPFEQVIRVTDAVPSDDLPVLRTLWARKRVERLSDLASLSREAKVEEQVTSLGLEHHLLTAFTSFVAIDSERRNRGPSVTVEQATPLPAGVSPLAVSGAVGGLTGGSIGYGAGVGGLGMVGTGAGGGGSSAARGRMSGVEGKLGKREVNIAAGAPLIMGSLDKEVIRRVIQSRRTKVAYCYEKALLQNPNLSGKVVIQLTIGGDGKVQLARVKESTIGNEAVESCVQKVMAELRFPAPQGGGVVVVTYPFLFRPAW